MGSLNVAVSPAPTFSTCNGNPAKLESGSALSYLTRHEGQTPPGENDSARHPLAFALLAQVLGTLSAVFLLLFFSSSRAMPIIAIAAFQGFCAMIAAWQLRAPVWWLIIHLVFMPLVIFAHGLELSPWLWFSGFVVLLLVFWRTDIGQAPLYLTNRKTGEVLLSLLPAEACKFVDLGCGDGGLLRYLARARPDCTFVGIEHAPLTFAWAWLFARGLPNLSIRRENIWSHPLGGYALIYAFLSPTPMIRLWTKAHREMSPGSRLVSNSFTVTGQTAQAVIDVEDKRQTRLHVYQLAISE